MNRHKSPPSLESQHVANGHRMFNLTSVTKTLTFFLFIYQATTTNIQSQNPKSLRGKKKGPSLAFEKPRGAGQNAKVLRVPSGTTCS